jgi:hypothetical protein
MSHSAKIIRTFDELLISAGLESKEKYEGLFSQRMKKPTYTYESLLRRCRRLWKAHVEKHGNVPMIRKCHICSGKERRDDIKKKVWKVSKREDQKQEKQELNLSNYYTSDDMWADSFEEDEDLIREDYEFCA